MIPKLVIAQASDGEYFRLRLFNSVMLVVLILIAYWLPDRWWLPPFYSALLLINQLGNWYEGRECHARIYNQRWLTEMVALRMQIEMNRDDK